jgi:hypothetical protein
MASNNNGAPYQKSAAGYHAIGSGSPTNGSGSGGILGGSGGSGGKKKWILGLGLVGVVAVVLGLYASGTIGNGGGSSGSSSRRSSAASKATLKKQVDDSGAKTNADGSLKLFDDMSKFFARYRPPFPNLSIVLMRTRPVAVSSTF